MKRWLKVMFGLSSLLMVSVSEAKCYPGLDCEIDLPGAKKKLSPEGWLMIDRYLVKEDLVKDPTTGLIWMRCSLGQSWDGSGCQGMPAEYNWEQAMSVSKQADYAGYTDWRMPTGEELKSLVYCSNGQTTTHENGTTACDGDYISPVIVEAAFPDTPISWFWTSSPSVDEDYMWAVSFYYGGINYEKKSHNSAVRLVRTGREFDF